MENQYDFEARQQTPPRITFTTQDPLADKYPGISPYAYCAGNPILYIDPDGRDYYGVDQNGNMTLLLRNSDAEDRIYSMINSSIDTDKFVNVNKDFTSNTYQMDYIEENIDVNYSNSNLSEVFTFLKDNTNVEWSHIITKDNNQNRTDYIGTTHRESGDYSGDVVFQNLIPDNYGIIEANHNHTASSYTITFGDIGFAKVINKVYPKANLFIHVPHNTNKKQFDEYSYPGLLPELVITPKQ